MDKDSFKVCKYTGWPTGERFLLAEDGDVDKIIVYASDESLRLLAEADDIYIDGTFRTCPRLFYQIFTIHAFFHGQQFPASC